MAQRKRWRPLQSAARWPESFRPDHSRSGIAHRQVLELLEGRLMLNAGVLDLPDVNPPPEASISVVSADLAESDRALPENPALKVSVVPAELVHKVDQGFWKAVEDLRGGLISKGANSELWRVNGQGAIQTYLTGSGSAADLAGELESMGIAVDGYDDSMDVVQAWVTPDEVDALAHLPGLSYMRLPSYRVTNTGSVTSAGDGILNADKVRSQFAAYGIDGSGIKVGVISDGVDHRANSQSTGDLPSITVNPSLPGSGDEGTAMLEIVHDLAPGAQLYFSGPNTSVDMVSSINWLVSQGCNVIVDDLGFFDQPMFQDGAIANAAANAVSSGVVYVSAAGNFADTHYQGQYLASPTTTWHDFDPGPTTDNRLLFTGYSGYVMGALEWSDPWGASSNDYDLYLEGWNGHKWVTLASSTQVQNGSQNPWEFVYYRNTRYSLLSWDINKYSGAPRELEFYAYGAIGPYSGETHYVASDSIFGHPAANGVIAAGAIDAADPGNDTIESYSSQGPSTIYTNFSTQTSIQRQSLAGAGIDGVQTEVGQLGYFYDPFYGTSAAAPHVAAVAALVREAAPALTPAQVVGALDSTAVDLTAYGSGYDNVSGYGRFNALDAVYEVFTPAPPALDPASDWGISDSDNITGDNTPTFKGAVPTASFVRLFVDGVEKGSQQLASGQSSYSITSSPLNAGPRQITIRVAASSSTPDANFSNASLPLTVTIDTAAPAANITTVAPDPRASSVDSVAIVFTQPVSGFDLSDLSLTRDGEPNLLGTAQTLSTTDNITWTLGNLSSLTDKAGFYSLTLNASGSGITDVAGNALAAGAVESWIMNAVNGTGGNDVICLIRDAASPSLTEVFIGNDPGPTPNYTVNTSLLGSVGLQVNGLAGDDQLTVDFSHGNLLPAGGLSYDGGTSSLSDLLAVVDSPGDDTMSVTAGQIVVDSQTITTVNVQQRTLRSQGGHDTLTSDGSELAALTLDAGTTVTLPAGGAQPLCVDHLSIAGGSTPTATLDLQTNSMVINYTGDPNGSPLSTIVGYVATGRAGGAWNGNGISGSTIGAQGDPSLYAIGVIDNTNPVVGAYPPDANGWMTSMEGVPTPASSVLVKFTWAGDADLDGQVTGADYDLIDNTWLINGGEGPAFASNPWYSGDFNYDGVVNGADYDLIDNVWLSSGEMETPSLPEPATKVLLAAGGGAVSVRTTAAPVIPLATASATPTPTAQEQPLRLASVPQPPVALSLTYSDPASTQRVAVGVQRVTTLKAWPGAPMPTAGPDADDPFDLLARFSLAVKL